MMSSNELDRQRPDDRGVHRVRRSALFRAVLVLAASISLTAVFGQEGISSEAVLVDGDAFIRHDYAEVGARANGSFGSTVAAPEGWHPRGGRANIGFVSDRDKDGWGVGIDDGDFFLPGYEYEGWGIEIVEAGEQLMFGWNAFYSWHSSDLEDRNGIPGGFLPITDPSTAAIDWRGVPLEGVTIEQRYSLPAYGGLMLDMDVTIHNERERTIDIYYARQVDIDTCQDRNVMGEPAYQSCTSEGIPWWSDVPIYYGTDIEIVSQTAFGGTISAVQASSGDGSSLVLWSADEDSVVFSGAPEAGTPFGSFCENIQPMQKIYGDLRNDAYGVANSYNSEDLNCSYWFGDSWTSGHGYANRVGERYFADEMVYLMVKKTIPAGESVTFRVTYALSFADFADSLPPELRSLAATRGSVPYSPIRFTPAFDPSVRAYEATVPYTFTTALLEWDTSFGAAIDVDLDGVRIAHPERPIPLEVGVNVITVTLATRAETVATTLTITRLPEADRLANLIVTPGVMSPAFDPELDAYQVRVAHDVTHVDLTATTADPAATLTVNGAPATSGTVTGPWPLAGLETIIPVIVTPSPSGTPRTTTVTILRDDPPQPEEPLGLITLTLTGVTLTPTFQPDTLTYTANVPYPITSTNITATASPANATITIDGAPATSGVAFLQPLTIGANDVAITITRGDETLTYQVRITRAGPELTAPTNLKPYPGDARAWITFTHPISTFTLIDIQASIDDGEWITPQPDESDPIVLIHGLTNGATHTIRLRGLFQTLEGPTAGPPSESVTLTPAAPVAPDVDVAADLSGDPPAASRVGDELEITFTFTFTNTGDTFLNDVWLDPRDLLPGERVTALTPGTGARGTITRLAESWYWQGITLAIGESANLNVTIRVPLATTQQETHR